MIPSLTLLPKALKGCQVATDCAPEPIPTPTGWDALGPLLIVLGCACAVTLLARFYGRK